MESEEKLHKHATSCLGDACPTQMTVSICPFENHTGKDGRVAVHIDMVKC